jgi:hypothetical protein
LTDQQQQAQRNRCSLQTYVEWQNLLAPLLCSLDINAKATIVNCYITISTNFIRVSYRKKGLLIGQGLESIPHVNCCPLYRTKVTLTPLDMYIKKGSPVHVAPACTRSDHFRSYVRSISLYFCKRLFPGLEPMTSWLQDNNFTAAAGLPFKTIIHVYCIKIQ